MPSRGILRTAILEYMKKQKRPVALKTLYTQFKGHHPNGIRGTVYKLVQQGLVERTSKKKPVTYKAK